MHNKGNLSSMIKCKVSQKSYQQYFYYQLFICLLIYYIFDPAIYIGKTED